MFKPTILFGRLSVNKLNSIEFYNHHCFEVYVTLIETWWNNVLNFVTIQKELLKHKKLQLKILAFITRLLAFINSSF